MATRSRGTSGRNSKSSARPPLAGSVLEDDTPARRKDDTGGANESSTEAHLSSTPKVTNTTLHRREIPSFSESREARIAEAAYWRAERRGFAPGQELEDWLEAEKQVDADKRVDS